jgi:hypothetical protein
MADPSKVPKTTHVTASFFFMVYPSSCEAFFGTTCGTLRVRQLASVDLSSVRFQFIPLCAATFAHP